jgi:hypothetical protein
VCNEKTKNHFSGGAVFLGVGEILATAQYPDKILYKGQEYALHTNPLEEYFESFPDKRPKTEIRSSALWRGYVATFELEGNSMLLKNVEIQVRKPTPDNRFETQWQSVLETVVPGNKKLKADWFDGILVLPYGKIVNYIHMGYASTFENYILLEIEKGEFKQSREFDYKAYENFKERQFEA